MSNRRCSFIDTRRGCLKGADCTYDHSNPNPPSSTSSRGGAGSGGRGGRGGGARGRGGCSGTPSRGGGRCQAYWTTGSCDWKNTCKYLQEDNPRFAQAPAASTSLATETLRIDPASAHSSPSDRFLSAREMLTPAQAQIILRKYEKDGLKIGEATAPIYEIGLALIAGNALNKTWNDEDREVTKKPFNLLLRLGEIIRHPNVVFTATGSRTALDFQRGYHPLIAYLSSEQVIQSTVHRDVNQLFNLVDGSVERFAQTVSDALNSILAAGKIVSIRSPSTVLRLQSFYHVLKPLATLFHEYLSRFKNVAAQHEEPAEDRAFLISNLRKDLDKLVKIVDRDVGRIAAPRAATLATMAGGVSAGQRAALTRDFVPPGGRHDNDHPKIQDITLAPTHEELVSDRVFLPTNFDGAPHHLPNGSMDRLFDIQFRLFREELIAPLRESVLLILEDLRKDGRTEISKIIAAGGGVYRRENSFMQVFTGVSFKSFNLGRSGFALTLSMLAPPRGRGKRSEFWDSKLGLSNGSLVGLIWNSTVWVGSVTSGAMDISKSYDQVSKCVLVEVAFLESRVGIIAVQALRSGQGSEDMLLVKSSVLYESIRPYLEALQTRDPAVVPFSNILVHGVDLARVSISPPTYAATPGFAWDLSCLLPKDVDIGGPLTFSVNDLNSIFGIKPAQAKLWRAYGGHLLEIYRVSLGIASRPSPHQISWDSAFVKAWNLERSKPRTTDQGALVLATRAMGHPRPRGRQRYAVEGIIESVQARFQLASIAQAFSAASSEQHPSVVIRWTLLATFLLQSSLQDAELAQEVALESLMYRQYMLVSVLSLRPQRQVPPLPTSRQAGALRSSHSGPPTRARSTIDPAVVCGRRGSETSSEGGAAERRRLASREPLEPSPDHLGRLGHAHRLARSRLLRSGGDSTRATRHHQGHGALLSRSLLPVGSRDGGPVSRGWTRREPLRLGSKAAVVEGLGFLVRLCFCLLLVFFVSTTLFYSSVSLPSVSSSRSRLVGFPLPSSFTSVSFFSSSFSCLLSFRIS